MTDWKDRLRDLLGSAQPVKKTVPMEEARERIATFLEDTVMPAFQEIAAELERYGRAAEIERDRHHVSIRVLRDGEEEFSYAVRGRIYHRMSFAFPEFKGRHDDPTFYRAEVELPSGTHDRDVHAMSRERIIDDFLEAYRKWMGW